MGVTQPATCRIDFSVDDKAKSVRAMIQRLSKITELPAQQQVVIDLAKCKYLGPDALTILAAVFIDRCRIEPRPRVIFPEGPRELRAFMRVSGFEWLTQTGSLSGTVTDEGHPVLPLAQFKAARIQDADPILTLLRRYDTLPEEFEEKLYICVNEVLQNAYDHAASPIGWVMMARFMTQAKEVRVAIVDRGDGIRTTLSRQFRDTTAENVLRRVMGGSYSAASRPNNQGLGLSNLADIVRQLGGNLVLLSEESLAEFRGNGPRNFYTMDFRFSGTGVFFTLPVRG